MQPLLLLLPLPIIAAPTATDNCGTTITGTTEDPLSYSEQGTYTITWTYDDGNGNIETQIQTVIVDDITKPVPDVASLPVISGECEASITTVPTATDNCEGTIIGTTEDVLSYDEQGTYTVTWTFDDGNGNIETQTQTVIVDDQTPPVIDEFPSSWGAPVDVFNLPTIVASCEYTITEFPTATDNCAGIISGTTPDPLYYDTPGRYPVRWTFDDGNGNQARQLLLIIIENQSTPTAICKDITVSLDADGTATIKPEDIDNGSFDGCGGEIDLALRQVIGFGVVSLPKEDIEYNCSNIGANTALLEVTNAEGLKASCEATVTVDGAGNCENSSSPGGPTTPNPSPSPNPGSGGFSGVGFLKSGASDAQEAQTIQFEAFPNPFTDQLIVSFRLAAEENASIEVFNMQGQQMKVLLPEFEAVGEHRVQWDGTDRSGALLPAGMYLVRLRVGEQLVNKRVLLQR